MCSAIQCMASSDICHRKMSIRLRDSIETALPWGIYYIEKYSIIIQYKLHYNWGSSYVLMSEHYLVCFSTGVKTCKSLASLDSFGWNTYDSLVFLLFHLYKFGCDLSNKRHWLIDWYWGVDGWSPSLGVDRLLYRELVGLIVRKWIDVLLNISNKVDIHLCSVDIANLEPEEVETA